MSVNTSDKILLSRGILGILSGFITLIYPTYFIILFSLIFTYIISVIISRNIFKANSKWELIGKGGLTFVFTWFLTVVIIYNVIHS
jgi:hypothetical protein